MDSGCQRTQSIDVLQVETTLLVLEELLQYRNLDPLEEGVAAS